MRLRASRGFTLVEIMIVVAIIGILIAIAVPGFIRARHTSRGRRIQNDLVKLDEALQQYALDFEIDTEGGGAAIPPMDRLLELKYFRSLPTSPIVGTDYQMPTNWVNFPYWDGTVPTGANYDELFKHPEAVDNSGNAVTP